MKIVLKVPGYTDVIFNNYEDLNFIWDVLNNYKNCTLEIIKDNEEKDNKEIVETEDIKEEEVKEDININNVQENDNITVSYIIPKKVVFTSRFQDSIKNDVSKLLNSVFPNCFNIENISYKEIKDDRENMQLNIDIKINENCEAAIDKIYGVDEDIKYIVDDLVDYYF